MPFYTCIWTVLNADNEGTRGEKKRGRIFPWIQYCAGTKILSWFNCTNTDILSLSYPVNIDGICIVCHTVNYNAKTESTSLSAKIYNLNNC